MSKGIPQRSIKSVPTTAQRRYFRIEVRGHVDQGWIAAFNPTSFSSSADATMIEVLTDQAGLRGILNRLWDLNLDILSVYEITEPADQYGGN